MNEEASPPIQSDASYSGRWVARLHGRIIAQGGTPEEAMRASQQSRYKEKPEITYVPTSFPLPDLVQKVKQILGPSQEIYLVGGAVRDLLLDRFPPDLDFAVPSNAVSIARKIANALKADFVILDEQRETARVIITKTNGSRALLDFATYRSADSSPGPGHSLEEDLGARDFTVNALAYDVQADAILDPLDGATDLRAKLLRACSRTSLTDDPVRILRGVRQAAALGFHIDGDTREWMKQAAGQLGRVSVERLRDELFKILDGPRPEASLRALEMLGALPGLLPELAALRGVEQSPPHIHDVWAHTLAVVAALEEILSSLLTGSSQEEPADPFTEQLMTQLGRFRERFADHFSQSLNIDRSSRALLTFAALYHDVSKPATRSTDENGRIRFLEHESKGAAVAAERLRAFNMSNDEIERVEKTIANHMRIHFHTARLEGQKLLPSRRAIYRFFRDAGDAGIDVVLLSLADVRGTRGATLSPGSWAVCLEVARLLLENYWERPEEAVSPARLVDGHELMQALELKSGPALGRLLESIRESQAAGEILDREQALTFARAQLAKWTKGGA